MQIYFPYDVVRGQQKELIQDITESIVGKKSLFANAPTGLGKTVSSLAPAIAYALQEKKKIFFLTPKISQHEIVLETVRKMNEKFGLGVKAVDLVGKKSLCLDPWISGVFMGFYEACAKKKKEGQCKHFNNTKGRNLKQKKEAARRKASILGQFNLSHLDMKEKCAMKELCPYEVTIEMCRKADVIIADYAHVFDSMIRDNIFAQANIKLEDCIVVVDEAHNLAERIRGMFTVSINLRMLEAAEKEAKSVGNFDAQESIKDIAKKLTLFGKVLGIQKSEEALMREEIDEFISLCKQQLEKIDDAAMLYLSKRNTERCYLTSVMEFIDILSRKYANTLYLLNRKNALGIDVIPLDVSQLSADVLNKCHSSVLMSGTLLPLAMHAEILGAKQTILKEYTSPFPKENRLNLFVEKTTTKYSDRSQEQYQLIADEISKVACKVAGNTIAFFPSFEMLERISPLIKSSRKILKQEQEHSSQQKNTLINDFRKLGNGFGALLLAVSGGSIAEGIDFPGEHLSCAIIIGVPFAKVSPYSNALIKFFEQKFGREKGFEYAYTAPAISKAVQAAGRVIRTETDKGVCVFLDKRFSDEKYRKFYPKDFVATKTLEPGVEVEKFFN